MATEKTANEQLYDYLVRHQIGLLLLASSLRKAAFQPIDETEAAVADAIRRRLANSKGLARPADVQRLDALLAIIKRIRAQGWQRSAKVVTDELEELTRAEPEQLEKAIKTIVPVWLPNLSRPTRGELTILFGGAVIMGRTLKGWLKALQVEDERRITAAIRAGMAAVEDPEAIVHRVVGTPAAKGMDGATQSTRTSFETILLTAINHFPHVARDDFVNRNRRLFREELYVAVLDSRTTPLCRSLDGNVYPVGEGPHPSLHWRCRSIRVPLLDGIFLGLREAKPFTDRMLRQEFINDPRETSWPEFRKRRINELTEWRPLATTYQEWLAGQSTMFQDEVLGKAKGALFRRGGLTLDKFVGPTGKSMTLAQLAKLHREAFLAAGLDPGDFL